MNILLLLVTFLATSSCIQNDLRKTSDIDILLPVIYDPITPDRTLQYKITAYNGIYTFK